VAADVRLASSRIHASSAKLLTIEVADDERDA